MPIDAKDVVKAGETLADVDICIIGSGAAGLTVAHEFLKSNKTVAVLESSMIDHRTDPPAPYREHLSRVGTLPHWDVPTHRYSDPSVQPVYAGTSDTDEPQSADFFLNQRIRVYGGTTNCWGGWTRPLAPLDFNRPEVNPIVSWPLPSSELDNGYRRAMEKCSLVMRPAADYDNANSWLKDTDETILPLDTTGTDLRTAVFTEMNGGNMHKPPYDGRLDFQLVWGPDIVAAAPRIQIYRNVNVTGFVWNGINIGKVKARSLINGKPGGEFFVSARKFVLAASCIENARLLLGSESIVPKILGEALGKYLFTHPMRYHAATFTVGEIDKDWQRRAAIQRFYNSPWPKLKEPSAYKPAVFGALAPTPNAAQTARIGNFRAVVGFGGSAGTVNFAWEQFANASNCIYLEADRPENRDKFGCLKARAKLALSSKDTDTLDFGLKMLGQGLEKMKVAIPGTWEPNKDDPTYLPGAHAMGTTRMSRTIDTGVVNTDCRAHNIDNLFIAGSSVFPAGGYSNPTLTVIALAIRLADHLKKLP